MNVLFISDSGTKAFVAGSKSEMNFSDVLETIRPLSFQDNCLVSVCRCKATGEQVAVKSYLKQKLSDASKCRVHDEIRIQSSLNDPSIVKLLAALEDSRHIYVILELAAMGDLRDHMLAMTERRAVDLLVRPLLTALNLMHCKGIIHRDLKPDNILVTQDHRVMVADFGLAMYHPKWAESDHVADIQAQSSLDNSCVEQNTSCSVHICGAAMFAETGAAGIPLYTAPEVLLCMFQNKSMDQALHPKNDVWAFGVILLEALLGYHPFSPDVSPTGHSNIMFTIAHLQSVPLPAHLSPAAKDFLSQVLRTDLAYRPSAAEMLSHPWVTEEVHTQSDTSSTSDLSSMTAASSSPSIPLPTGCFPVSRATSSDGESDGRFCHTDAELMDFRLMHRRVLSKNSVVECWES